MPHWVQGWERQLQSLLKLAGKDQFRHIRQILFQGIQFLGHGLTVVLNGLELSSDGGNRTLQRMDGLPQAAVSLPCQLFECVQQRIRLIQRILKGILRLIAEVAQVLPQLVQAPTDAGGILIQGIGHGPKILHSLRPGGMHPVLNGRQGILDGLGIRKALGGHGVELVGKVLQPVK